MRTRFVCAATLASCYIALAQQSDCTAEANGYYYNLAPLRSKSDYKFNAESGVEFRLNVCAAVNSETWSLPNPSTVGAFYRGAHGDVSIGVVNTTVQIKDSNPILILSDGTPCGEGNNIRAATAIRFICDNDVFGVGQPQLVAQLPPDGDLACAFFFEWRTHVACPTAEPSGPGSIIAILAAVALILLLSYLVVGVVYRRFALGYRGFDQFPQISLVPLSALPHALSDVLDWLRDIRDHLRGGARDLWPRSNVNGRPYVASWRRRRDGFSPLAQEEQAAMFRDGQDGPEVRFPLGDEAEVNGARELTATIPTVPPKEQDIMFRDDPDGPDARFSLADDADLDGARELPVTIPTVPPKDADNAGGAIRL